MLIRSVVACVGTGSRAALYRLEETLRVMDVFTPAEPWTTWI